jgi:hypothetical protein
MPPGYRLRWSAVAGSGSAAVVTGPADAEEETEADPGAGAEAAVPVAETAAAGPAGRCSRLIAKQLTAPTSSRTTGITMVVRMALT